MIIPKYDIWKYHFDLGNINLNLETSVSILKQDFGQVISRLSRCFEVIQMFPTYFSGFQLYDQCYLVRIKILYLFPTYVSELILTLPKARFWSIGKLEMFLYENFGWTWQEFHERNIIFQIYKFACGNFRSISVKIQELPPEKWKLFRKKENCRE